MLRSIPIFFQGAVKPSLVVSSEVLELNDRLTDADLTNIESDGNAKEVYHCERLYCQKQFSSKQNYSVHLKAVHDGERPFNCEFCDKTFAYCSSLKLHLLRHKKKIDCEEASSDPYQCSACGKTFRHPSSLQYHRDAEHANGRRCVYIF